MADSNLAEKIKVLVHSIGKESCVFYPTAYTTAWVSRIPEHKKLNSPAFPQALAWLRKNQLSSGGWGTINPANPYANTLSTLAVILALIQWKDPQDKILVEQGKKALINLSSQLIDNKQKTFGFELLLAALLEEFQQKNLSLPEQVTLVYQQFLGSGDAQREMLKTFIEQGNYQNTNIFWLCLEMLGGIFLTDKQQSWPFPESVLASNGSLLGSVAASAYFLAAKRFRGEDVETLFDYLKKITNMNDGGAPPYHPMEEFELAFALDFLLKGEVPLRQLDPAINRLQGYWQRRSGLGYSIYSPSLDADDTALGLIIQQRAGNNKADYKSLLEFFNGNYLSHYKEDPTPSISVNANALRALSYFQNKSDVQEVIAKILAWINIQLAQPLDEALQDKWHISPFYAASALIFALAELDSKLSQRCVDWLLTKQNQDGGWGYTQISTLEETALALLALKHAAKKDNNHAMKKAALYMNAALKLAMNKNCLYMGSVMVCPVRIVDATILAACNVMNQSSVS